MVKQILRKLGLEIHRYVPPAPHVQLPPPIITSLRKFGIDLVLDVGANQGQFASEIRRGGFTGRIVSFEPLSSAHKKLLQVSNEDNKWNIYSRCALGDRNGEIQINIAGNSVSSSILPMLETHLGAAPESAYQGKEMVPIKSLDSVAGALLNNASAPFLKIDTQGFEWQVLDGARDTLRHIRGIQLELSLVPLYEGQHLWQEMIARLEAEGFTLWALEPVFTSPFDGRTLQLDGIFFRI